MHNTLKRLLTAAFVLAFMAGTAIAQNNTASINNVSGDDNEALIEQVGQTNNGRIYLEQSDKNDVEIDQDGTNNRAAFEFRGDRNMVEGEQDGTGNQMFVNFRGTGPGPTGAGASRSDFFFKQNGHDNKISGGIIGNRNEGDVRQNGQRNELLGSGGLFSAEGIMIDGNRNYVWVRQNGQDNIGVLNAVGNRNSMKLSQHGQGHDGEILINGSNNDHEITQSN
jgi:hypothetical protein